MQGDYINKRLSDPYPQGEWNQSASGLDESFFFLFLFRPNIPHQIFIPLFCCLVGWQIYNPTWIQDSKANSAFSIAQIGDGGQL